MPAHLSASVAQSAASTSRAASVSTAFRPFSPLLVKGLLIVSTYKIIAWSSAAVVLLALIFVGGHWLRSGASGMRHTAA